MRAKAAAARRPGAVTSSYLRRAPNARLPRCRAAAEAPTTPAVLLNNLFEDLCEHAGVQRRVRLAESESGGVGLFATEAVAKGEALLRVPRSLAIVNDNEAGSLSIPQGQWPRLTGGIMQETALTWDLLQALALMDATAGDGDQLWELYSDHFLPQPEALTLPMCWPAELLQELQHPAIINAALEQQERLRTLLPAEYMQPIGEGQPSYLQWGFACVRSRALQLGPQAFGVVPFADLANHAADPNAGARAAPGEAGPEAGTQGAEGGGGGGGGGGGFVELVAVRDVPAGEEVTISYSGPAGLTNRRFMAQYGFVPRGGNAADRLELEVPERLARATLRLSYLEDALGASLLLDAARGNNPYLLAALRSLPVTADDPGEGAREGEGEGPGPAAAGGRGIGAATPEERQLAEALLLQVRAEADGAPSTLQQDEALLERLQEQLRRQQQQGGGGGGNVRLAAAVRYRLERKRLLAAAQVLLGIFLRE